MREENDKNASISTKTMFKSVHKTLFHKLNPFIGSCYNLHKRYGDSKSPKHLEILLVNPDVHIPRGLSPFRVGGITYLNDPDGYVGWSFYIPGRSDRLKGRGQTM